MAAVIWLRRRHRRNERMRCECVFTTHINIFGLMKAKRKQTYSLSSDAVLELSGELWAELEPFIIPTKPKRLAFPCISCVLKSYRSH